MKNSPRPRRGLGAIVLLATLVVGPVWGQPKDYTKLRGFVDKEGFTGLVGEDDVQIEVWLPGSLLRLVGAVDPELANLVGGLELAQAVVVETDSDEKAGRLVERLRSTESALIRKGWIRLAKIKDGGEHISVLVLSDEDAINGLTVMVSEPGAKGTFVFANVVGRIDLAAIQRLGEQMSIPGLDQLELEED